MTVRTSASTAQTSLPVDRADPVSDLSKTSIPTETEPVSIALNDKKSAPLSNRQIQEALNAALADETPLKLDGAIGPQTRARVREFQLRFGLEPTGQLDRTTRDHLGFLYGERQTEIERFKMSPEQAKEFQRDLKLACYLAGDREKTAPHYLSEELEVGRKLNIREGNALARRARGMQVDGVLGPETQQLTREFGRFIGIPVPTGNPIESEAVQQVVRAYASEYRRLHP